jgi:flagellar M-ring protein FliF
MKSKEDKEFHRSQAQQLKLSRTISMRPEIDWATVQFREVKREGFPPVTERKATVVACGTNRQPIDRTTLRTIRAMTSSWFGIHLEDVAVTDVNGGIVDDLSTGDGMSKEARMYADAKSHYEELWKTKIYECLAFIPGVVATVNVEVDPIISSESTKVDLDPQAVAVQSDSFTKTSQSRPSGGGRPGAVPNEVAGNQPRSLSTMSAQETSADESREQQVSVAGHEQTRQRQATLVPKLVTAAVSIPTSYYKKVWHERNPTAPDQEPREPTAPDLDPIEVEIMQSVEEIVTVNLPVAPSADNSLTQVKVSSYDDLTVPPPEQPSMVATAGSWLAGNWQKIGLFVVGLISLLVLRSMTRATAPASSPGAAAAPSAPLEEEQQEEPEPHPVLHRRGASSGSSLREELTAIVREDPDAAANVLRTWIGDAA